MDTPHEVCEKRDVKGLYKKAREGKIKGMLQYCVSLAKYIHVPTQCHACNHNGDIHLVQVSLELTVPMRHLRTLILC